MPIVWFAPNVSDEDLKPLFQKLCFSKCNKKKDNIWIETPIFDCQDAINWQEMGLLLNLQTAFLPYQQPPPLDCRYPLPSADEKDSQITMTLWKKCCTQFSDEHAKLRDYILFW